MGRSEIAQGTRASFNFLKFLKFLKIANVLKEIFYLYQRLRGVTTLTNAVWALLGPNLSRPGNLDHPPEFLGYVKLNFLRRPDFFLQCPGIIACFPEKFPIVPIPGSRNFQIPGTILALSRHSVCQSCHPRKDKRISAKVSPARYIRSLVVHLQITFTKL